MRVRIVTDSASDITWDFADKNKIKIVPLNLFYNDKSHKETREHDYDKYYENYQTQDKFSPKTSQPSPQDFYLAYEELAKEEAKDIIVITISGALSGTMNSARVASMKFKEFYPDVNVHLVDSKNASYAEGFLIEEAIELVEKEKEPQTIVQKLRSLVSRIRSYLLVPTLKYLYVGGRISWTKYMLARLLRRKAIIKAADDGSLQPVGAIGDVEEGAEKIIELISTEFEKLPRKIAVVYATNYDLRDKIIDLIKEKIPQAELRLLRTRAAITAHVGPSTIAIISDFGLQK
jgi:DegV family protein with EDD domain